MFDRYVAQVRLLLSTLQEVASETVFALEGGTAINLFYRACRGCPSISI